MTPDPDAPLLSLIARVESGAASVDTVAAALAAVEAHERRAKELRRLLEGALMEHIRATGEDLVVGDDRYRLGHKATTKCVDVFATVGAVLAAAGGDEAGLAAVLCSDPFKVGAARDLLPPDVFARLFRTTAGFELIVVKVATKWIEANRLKRLARQGEAKR